MVERKRGERGDGKNGMCQFLCVSPTGQIEYGLLQVRSQPKNAEFFGRNLMRAIQ